MKKKLIAAAVMAIVTTGSVFAQTVDTLAKIKATGVVNFGVRASSGLGYTSDDGKYVGFHTEMGERIIDDIKRQLGLSTLKINYRPITSQNRIALLQNETIDFECGSTTNNRVRQKDADFAITTYVEEVRIAVKANSGIKSLEDLNGKRVASTTGTTSVRSLHLQKRVKGLRFKDVLAKDHAESFALLETGKADAFVMDVSILAYNISRSKTPKNYQIVGEALSVDPIACMLPKGDVKLKAAIDNSIKRQIQSGSLAKLAKLYGKWLVQPIGPDNVVVGLPLTEKTKQAWANPNNKPAEDYKL